MRFTSLPPTESTGSDHAIRFGVRRLLPALLLILVSGLRPASAAISIQDAPPAAPVHNAANTVTLPNFTVTAGANVLIVEVFSKGSTVAPTSVTWGSVTLIQAVHQAAQQDTRRAVSIFYAFSPPAGTNNVVASGITNSTNSMLYAFTLNGVNTALVPLTASIEPNGTAGTSATVASVNINNVTAASMAICAAALNTTANITSVLTGTGGAGTTQFTGLVPAGDTGVATNAIAGYVSNLASGSVTVTDTVGANTSTKFPFAVAIFTPFIQVGGPPTVTSITPTSGPNVGGFGMTINGTNFSPTPTVQFIMPSGGAGTVNANSVVWLSTNVLSCRFPAATPSTYTGTADIKVINPNLDTVTAPAIFTYTNSLAPTVTGIAPVSGPTAGGTVLTISGTGFSPASTVTIGGAAPTNVIINSDTSITVTTPAGTTGQQNVVVTNPDNKAGTLTGGYTYINTVTFSPFNLSTVGTGNGIATAQLTYFDGSQIVTITPTPANAAGVAIYYTTDGSTPVFPVGASTTQLYTAPFTITANTTVRAIEVVTSNGTNGPLLTSVYVKYLAAAASPAQLTTGSMNYVINATNALPPFNTGSAITASGIVTAAAPDILTNLVADRAASTFAPGTTPLLPTLLGEGTLLNGRPLATGNSNGSVAINAFQARFTGILNVPNSGVYTLVTGSDDGSQLYIDPLNLNAPDNPHLVVANNVGQGVIRRSGQIGLQAGQHTIVVDYANTGGGFGIELLWDPNGGGTFVNIPNINLGVQSQLLAAMAPTLTTYGGTSLQVTLSQSVAISNAAPTGSFVFYTTDGTTPTFDATFNATGSTTKYTVPFSITGNKTVNAIAAGPGYLASGMLSRTYSNVAPTVTSTNPAVGSPTSNGALTITITGANFSQPSVTKVEFGAGNAATNVTVVNSTTITCTLPNSPGGATGLVNVIVTNNDTQVGTLTNGFRYSGNPTITFLSVGAGPNNPENSGTSIGGETFTLSGTNFAAGATVLFGTNPATGISVLNPSILSGITPASSLPIPPGPGGGVSITYTGQDGRTVTQIYNAGAQPSGFIYVPAPAPTASAVSPSVGPLGGGTVVTITGTNFGAGASVKVDGIAAANVVVNSATSITATVPANTTSGSKNVVVANKDGQFVTIAGGFTYLGAANGTAISFDFVGDNSGGNTTVAAPLAPTDMVGVASVARGNWNSSLTGNTGTYSTLIDSTGASVAGMTVSYVSNEAWSNTEGTYNNFIAAGTDPNVRMMRGYLNTTTNNLPNGVIARVNNIPASRGAFDVYVYGDGANGGTRREGDYTLFANTTVTQHLVDAANVNFSGSPIFVQCLPTNATPNVGNYLVYSNVTGRTGTSPTNFALTNGFELDITATTADGSARAPLSGIQLVFYDGFQLAGVTPAFGPIAGGTTIRLKGTGFTNAVPANLAVIVGGVQATAVTFVDSNTITAVTAAGTTVGLNHVVLVNGDAAASSTVLLNGFSYVGPAPTVTAINPTQGITSGGTAVTITGTNFIAGATVKIGGNPCTGVLVASSTSINATTGPSTTSGLASVVVQNPGDVNVGTLPNAFTYLAPTVTAVTPVSGPAIGNFPAAIDGTNFGSQTQVLFGTIPAPLIAFNGSTSLTVLVPGSANGAIGPVSVTASDGANSFGTLPNAFTYTQRAADLPLAAVLDAGVEAKFFLNGNALIPNAKPPAGVPTALDALLPVKGLRVNPAVTSSIMSGPTTPAGIGNGTLLGLATDTLGGSATNFYAKFSGYIKITGAGGYTFKVASDDGATVFIGNSIVIDNNPGTALVQNQGVANLAAGYHVFTVLYGQGTGNFGFSLQYSGPDQPTLGFVPDSVLFLDTGSPAITSVSPNSGPINGNALITITGTGFANGANVVVNGRQALNVSVVNATTITFNTPASFTASGPANVVVVNPTGLAATFRPFTFTPRQPENPADVVQGTYFRYYTLGANGTPASTPNNNYVSDAIYKADNLIPFRNGWRTNVISPTTVIYPISQNDNHTMLWIGYITVPATGTYTFSGDTDDNEVLSIGNTEVIRFTGNGQGTGAAETGTIDLAAGTHSFRYAYSQGGGGFGSLYLRVAGPGLAGTIDIGASGTAFSYRPPTWKGGTANFNSQASWVDNIVPDKSETIPNANESLHLRFGDVGAAPYTVNNDRPAPLRLFKLELLANLNATNIIGGNQLQFVGNAVLNSPAGTAPNIDQAGSKAFQVGTPIDVVDNMKLLGTGTGLVTLAGDISNGGSITKEGTSTYVITGSTNTFAGALVVSAGSLGINGSLAPSVVTVNANGVLRGTGSVLGPINVSGGKVFPGDVASTLTNQPVGALTVGDITFATGGIQKVRVYSDGPAGTIRSDKLIVTGSISLGGTSSLELRTQSPNGNYTRKDTLVLDVLTAGNSPFGSVTVSTSATTGMKVLYVTNAFVPGTTLETSPSVVGVQAPGGAAPVLTGGFSKVYVRFDGAVTPVTMTSFAARPDGAGVSVEWEQVSEFQNAGFNVYRRSAESRASSGWIKLNDTLIPGRITDPSAQSYRFYDWAAPGTYEYRLETIDSAGGHGTFYPQTTGAVSVDDAAFAPHALSLEGLDAALSGLALAQTSARGTELSSAFAAKTNSFAAPLEEQTMSSATPRLALNEHGKPLMTAALKELAAAAPRSAYAVDESNAAPRASALDAPGVLPRAIARPARASRTIAKVVYGPSGVLRIPQAMLPAGFNIGKLSAQRAGVTLAPLALTADSLLLYARGYSDDYTDKDAIFLSATTTPTQAGVPARAQSLFNGVAEQTSSTASAAVQFRDTYFDWDLRPYDYPPYFSSKYLTAGSTQQFHVNAANVGAGAAVLTVNAWSLTSAEGASPDHALQAFVNGVAAGQAVWSGGGRFVALQFQVPPGVLAGGDNTVDLVTPSLRGVPSQIAMLHSLSLDYTRSLSGPGIVEINSGARGGLYEVAGLTTPALWVVDARFPDRAALVPYETQAQPDGTHKARFTALTGGAGKYLVVPSGAEVLPFSVAKRSIKPVPSGIQYLATGPNQFAAPLQSLIATRSKEGLKGAFVDQEQLFDYYNYGRYGPDGIRNAVRSARPQYLLLAGRTTFDYHNYSGRGIDPLCPTYLVSSSFWSQTTSDAMFGDMGRGLPEVRIGRIPANDPGEMRAAVQRILAHQGQPASAWSAMLTADSFDPAAGDFAANADGIIAANPAIAWTRNYLGVTSATSPEVTAALKQAANSGAGLLLYEGHGNAARLGKDDPRILEVDSVKEWTGNSVFIASTCTFNWVANNVANYHSIPIQALTQPHGGMAASIASTSYINAEPGVQFTRQLLAHSQTLGQGARWGDVLLRAQQWANQQSGAAAGAWYLDLSRTECILGDPAMPVFSKRASPAAGKPSTPGTF